MKKIVHKVTEGMDRTDILCTTYQMRNFYRQLGDGFFSALDIMNYIQHYQIAKWCKPHNEVLDVCCGRGLMLPLLRYHAKDIKSYTGVDIRSKNAIWQTKRVTDGKPINKDEYYPFKTTFINSNVAEMSDKIDKRFDVIIYTSSIEHMHKEDGQKSLEECYKLCKPNGIMILTCPNTPENQDGYDTQYKAHVYEWKRSELLDGLRDVGFTIITEWGIMGGKRDIKDAAEKLGLLPLVKRLEKFIPNEFLIPVLAPMFPKTSKEIAILVKKGV